MTMHEASETTKTPSTPERSPWTRRIVAVVAGVGLLCGAGVWWMAPSAPVTHYVTVPAARGDVTRSVSATGTVNPELTVIVGSYVSGAILEVSCDYNTRVRKGQICARIDPRPYRTQVDQSRANLEVAVAQLAKDQAGLTYAGLSRDRSERLVETRAVSQDAVDSARNAYDQALAQITYDQATIHQRQAALDAAQVNLDYTDITSPVDGTVVSRNVTVGQTVAASFQTPTLFLIATDLTRMQVDTNVSESDIGGVKTGDVATFTVDAFPKRAFAGTVGQVRQSPQTVQNVVTYDVVAGVANADLALKPGMTAAVRIVTEQRSDVLRVPNVALRFSPTSAVPAQEETGTRIWILRGDRAVATPIEIGLQDDTFSEVVTGDVKPGDRVITMEQSVGTARTAAPRLRF